MRSNEFKTVARNDEKSYGILLHRYNKDKEIEFFLIKPTIPGFWVSGVDVWGFPKGRAEAHEKPMETAFREFKEEVGMEAPRNLTYSILEPFTTSRGKLITIFSADATGEEVMWRGSNIAEIEYPPSSGNIVKYYETVTGGWVSLDFANAKLDGQYNRMLHQVVRREKMKKMLRAGK